MDEGKYKAELYRQRAADMRFRARTSVDDATRDELLHLADSWDRLADRLAPAAPVQRDQPIETPPKP